jgi:hypothetical protein
LGIAFAYSGATGWASKFLALYEEVTADYEITERTDPGFILFRHHCWKIIAWIETMKAAWASACANGSLIAIAGGQSQLMLFDISAPLLKSTKEAVRLVQEVQTMKERNGHFEAASIMTGMNFAN